MAQTANQISDYADTAGLRLTGTETNSGKQPGDPARAADAIIHIAALETMPLHLVLGGFGVTEVPKKLKATLANIEAWGEFALATDFPKV